ncbi:MAG TPA: phosphoglycerate dehydrogenase [Peptococcaceae bacterium]|nr:MAG: Phosphoglycerate dehydrogenase and related dehydrogenase [Clostridia bacterium 41_269]HBT19778.1 phosphoglycerate dehydrogenase [Peptococcaceae bacterium]
MRVLITDSVSEKGVEVLQEAGIKVDIKTGLSEDEIAEIIGDYDALIVRSQTKVTRKILDKAASLKIIGRAGVGVDNIDLDAATEKGIIVVNAPEGNTIAAAEHTMAMMLALARNIPQAHNALINGTWDRKSYMGVELRNKVLGILGLGKIGSEVAKRSLAMEMKVLAYDPFVSSERAEKLGVKLVDLRTLFKEADFITIHLPLNDDTRHLIDKDAIAVMKPGVRIINVARGGIVDEEALYEALKEGKVAGAAIDVFENEPRTDSPLFELKNVVVTPHLGASTKEAQINVAVDVAKDIVRYYKGEAVKNAVNAPSVSPEVMERLNPYLELSHKMGKLLSQLMRGIEKVEIQYFGDIVNYEVGILTNSFLRGLLEPMLNSSINLINAPYIAKSRGIKVYESKTLEAKDYTNLISVAVETKEDKKTISGTVFSSEPRIVRYDGFSIDAVPQGHMLVVPHIDKPRIVGPVATILGDHGINIAGMQVGRESAGGQAIMFLSVDSEVPEDILEEISKMDGILGVKYVYL